MIEPRRRAAPHGRGKDGTAPRAARPALILACLAATLLMCEARAEVQIEGIEGDVLANALAFLDIDDLGCDAPERLVRQALDGVRDDVRRSMEAFGYYDVGVESTVDFEPDCFLVSIKVDPGPRVLFRTVDIGIAGEAASDAEFAKLLDVPTLARGQPLLQGEYEALKRRLQGLAQQRGYVEARFTASRIDVYPAERAADVELKFDSGPRYAFGDLEIDSTVLRKELIAGYLGFRPGDPYSTQAVADFQIALRESGYFEFVDVSAMPADPATHTIPLSVSLVPAPRKLLTYGVGFSTDTGPRIKFGRTIRRFNDRGHQLGLNAQISPVVSEIDANYRMPRGDPRTEWLSFDSGLKREHTETSDSSSLELGVRRVFERDNGWTRTQLVKYLVEDFTIADQEDRSRFLMPGAEWFRLNADNTVHPRRGYRLDFELRAAAERLISDTSFVQGVVAGKLIRSLPTGGRILFRGRIGSTWEDSFRSLPPSVRFFAGGDGSVRGYEFESLGPVDADGKVIGGSRLVTSSIEYEHPVRNRWSVAVFTDKGNAFDGTEVDLKTGVGIGARWQSPLGPIRIDVAKPLDGPDHGLRLHISLGPDL